jgi:CHAT domain-containing protein
MTRTLCNGLAVSVLIAFATVNTCSATEVDFYVPLEKALVAVCEAGNFKEALRIYEPSTDAFKALAKKYDRIKLSRASTSCALNAYNQGALDDALGNVNVALATIEGANDPDPGTLAQALGLHGQILLSKKDILAALQAHKRSVAIFQSNFPKELGRVDAIHSYGLALLEGQYVQDANAQLETAIKLALELGISAQDRLLGLTQNLTRSLQLLGRSSDALAALLSIETLAHFPTMGFQEQALVQYQIGHALLSSGDETRALDYFQLSLKTHTKSKTFDASLNRELRLIISTIAHKLGKTEDSIRALLELQPSIEVTLSDTQSTAFKALQLSDAYWQIGSIELALASALRTLELAKEVSTTENNLRIKARIRITYALFKLNRLKQADVEMSIWFPLGSSLGLLPAELQLESAEVITSIHSAMGRYNLAETFVKHELELRLNALSMDRFAIATAKMNHGVIVQGLGRFTEAAILFRESLEDFRLAPAKDLPNVAICTANLASTLSRLGQPREALLLYEKAIELEIARAGKSSPYLKGTYANYSILLKSLGRTKEALYFTELGQIDVSNSGANPSDTVREQLIVAITEIIENNHAKAESLLLNTLSVSKSTLGEMHPQVADVLSYLGWLSLQSRSFGDAEKYFIQSLNIRKIALGANHPEVISAFYNLGTLYDETKQTQKSIANFTEGLVRLRQLNEPQLSWLIEYGLSRAYGRLNDVDASLFWGWKALFSIQTLRQSIETMGSLTRSSFVVDKLDVFNWVAELLIQTGRVEEAQGVVYLLKQEEFTEIDSAQKGPSFSEFASISVRKLIDQYTKSVEASDDELRKFIVGAPKLSKALSESSDLSFGTYVATSSDQLRSQLRTWRNQSAFVHYLVFKNESWAVVTTTEGKFTQKLNFGSTGIQSIVNAFRNQLQDTAIDPREMAKELYTMLIRPIERVLFQAKVNRLLFSLDDALRYLPMAALHDGNSYLIEKYGITLYTEGSRSSLASEPSRDWTVAGFGVTKEHPGASALPAVKDEFVGIVDSGILPGSYALDENFNLDSFTKALSSKANVLHIASHFKFDSKKADSSFLLLGDGSHLSLKMIKDSKLKFTNIDLLTLSACETGLGGGRNLKGKEVEGFGVLGQKLGAKSVLATLWEVADESTAITMQTVYRVRKEKNQSVSDSLRSAQLDLIRGTQRDLSKEKLKGVSRRFAGEADTEVRPPQKFIEEKGKPFSHPFYWAPFILMGNPL